MMFLSEVADFGFARLENVAKNGHLRLAVYSN
jgi:hypothetical protein